MRTILKFMCEKCRAVYDTPREALFCEAGHYHLTVEEYDQWLALQKLAADAGRIVGIQKNEQTDSDFDAAIQKLLDFERAHKLNKV